jgi:hypothetical protein
MRRRSPAVVVTVLALIPACSGAGASDLLAPGGPSFGTDGGGDGSSHVSLDAGAADTGSAVDSGAGGHLDSGAPDTGTPVVDSGSGSSSGGAGTVSCGTTMCALPSSFCCVSGLNPGGGGTPSYKCDSNANQCSSASGMETPVRCDKTADCKSGYVCCGDNQNGFYAEVTCVQDCTGTSPSGGTYIQFCDQTANDCMQGTTCQPSQALPGYFVCR